MPAEATKAIQDPAQMAESQEMESASTHDQIAVLAYRLWQERGCPVGSPEVDWLQAEQEMQAKVR